MKRILFLAALLPLLLLTVAADSCAEDAHEEKADRSSLENMELAFVGDHSQAEIKQLLDKAMTLYGLTITEETYSRAGSTLVGLRKEFGPEEMVVLDYMIRSHVEGVDLTFPEAASWAVVALMAGDQ